MKRSEALKRIQTYLDVNAGHLEVPEQILNFVEGLGMQPPPIDILPELTSFQKFLEKIGIETRRYAYEWESSYEWELEDEHTKN